MCAGVAVLAETASIAVSWGSTPAYQSILFALYTLTIVLIGGLIAVRHPGNPIGWILAGIGTFNAVFGDFIADYGHRASTRGWPGGPLAEWIGYGSWAPAVLMWILALLLVPTGRLPGPRWRIMAYAGCAGTALYMAGYLLDPGTGGNYVSGANPYAVAGPEWHIMAAAGGVLMTLALIGSFSSLVVRYRAAGPVERLQLKWVALAGLDIVVLAPVCFAFWDSSPFVRALTPVILIIAALCLGASVLRYRLFDVDLIVDRTVVYLALSVLLAAAYGATVIVLGAVLGGQSSWTVAGGTLIAAVAFRPLRRRVQDLVDRRFARERYSASMRIDAFMDRLRAGTEQPERVENLLRAVLHDPALRILLLLPASHQYSDLRGSLAVIDPARPTVTLHRGGSADVIVEYARTSDPAHVAAVRAAVEHSRLAIEIARLGVGLNRQLAESGAVPDPDRERGRRRAPPHPARPPRRLPAAARHRRHLATDGRSTHPGRGPDRRGRPARHRGRRPRRNHHGTTQPHPEAAARPARRRHRGGFPRAGWTRAAADHHRCTSRAARPAYRGDGLLRRLRRADQRHQARPGIGCDLERRTPERQPDRDRCR